MQIIRKSKTNYFTLGYDYTPLIGLTIEFNSIFIMKVRCSLKSAKNRDKDCKLVRRKGRIYIINKKNPRMKARQG